MAKIEDLISRIPDDRLREAIASEVKELKKSKRFGLVFEEHLPETVRLPFVQIRKGSLVAKKAEPGNACWVVRAVKGKNAECLPEGEKDYTKKPEVFAIKDLVAVKPFGEPIFPKLTPIDRVARGGPDKPWHVLINADNFHALQLLLYCYERQVDVIYIDPPYNTGARDWKYNNDYVDKTDSFRHSKWLSMMRKRLLLAKRLLKPDGVMIVTIDEHEVDNLGVLLRESFREARVQMVTIVTNTAGSMSPRLFSRSDEYAYFVFFGQSGPRPMPSDLLAEAKSKTQCWFPLFRSRGLNDRPSKRPNLVFPIFVNPKTLKIVGVGRSLKERIETGEITGDIDKWRPDPMENYKGQPLVWPILDTGELTTWQLGSSALLELANEGFVRVRKPRGNGPRAWSIAYVKSGNRRLIKSGAIKVVGRESCGAVILENTESQTIPKTTWKVAAHDARLYGTTMLRSILGTTSFTYPKSPYAVRDALQSVLGQRKEGLILDFFAGSGTTYQAVSMLNYANQGRLRSIHITNNEVIEAKTSELNEHGFYQGDSEFESHGICEATTWPRCKFLTNGSRDDGTKLLGSYLGLESEGEELNLADGFTENLEYFRLDFVEPSDVERGEAFEGVLPILWMMAGCIGEREDRRGGTPYYIAKHSPFAVLIKEAYFSEFEKKLAERDDLTHIFLVTDSEENFAMMRRELGRGIKCHQLYKSYLENFRLNADPSLTGRIPGAVL